MGDGARSLEVIPDYFDILDSAENSPQLRSSDTSLSGPDSPHTSTSGTASHVLENPYTSHTRTYNPSRKNQNSLLTRRNLRSTSFMLKLFSLRGLRFSGLNGDEKVELSAVQLESLRSELADVEEREAHLKAQLEHLDEILRRARLSGYLYVRTRWEALPGELPPVDDGDVDDWIPRFVVLQGQCIFFYLSSMDLSPQDSTLLSDIVEVESLPSLVREDDEIWHCFYIVTRFGLRVECSSASRIQVDSWLTAFKAYRKSGLENSDSVDHNCKSDSEKCVSVDQHCKISGENCV